MKKIKWLLVCAGCCCFAICHSQFIKMEPAETDSLPNYFLKEAQLNLLASAAQVTAFRVHDFKAAPAEIGLLEEFRILQKKELTEIQTANIKQALAAPQNYFFTSKIKQCMFLPQYGIQVASENDTMNVLMSFGCETVRFYDQNGFQLINLHLGAKPFSDFFSMLFPEPIAAPELEPITTVEGLADMSFDMMECATEKGVFQTKMDAPQPIHYIIMKDDKPSELAQKVQTECDLSIPIEKLCELNNLTIADLQKLKPGDAIVIGYE